ncbi:MAG: hypothetical protein IJ593_04320 [Lachnospiraceae bacterium]|nr:hypothetical protein [Lachnospiraceae bacterium]
MEKEVSAALRIGLMLIVVAIVLSMGMVVYRVIIRNADNIAEDIKSNEVDKKVMNVYADFNNTVVSGSKVIDLINTHTSNDICVLVRTRKLAKNIGVINSFNGLVSLGLTDSNNRYFVTYSYANNNFINNMKTKDLELYRNHAIKLNTIPTCSLYKEDTVEWYSKGNYSFKRYTTNSKYNLDGEATFINYRSILGSKYWRHGYGTQAIKGVAYSIPYLRAKTGADGKISKIISYDLFVTDGDKVLQNNEFSGLNDEYAIEYILPESRFNAYWVESPDGTFLGIAFIEIDNLK